MKKILCVLIALLMITGSSFVAAGASAESTYTPPEEFIYGDVDMDGEVTVRDATLIQKGVAGLNYLTGVEKFLAGFDNSDISVKNATMIQKNLADISVEGSRIGIPINMTLQNEFSSNIPDDDALFEGDCIIVQPKLEFEYVYEYTLKDFPEYEFERMEVVGSKSRGNVIYMLYLKNSNKNSIREAIKALDYRANFDLNVVIVNYIYVSANE